MFLKTNTEMNGPQDKATGRVALERNLERIRNSVYLVRTNVEERRLWCMVHLVVHFALRNYLLLCSVSYLFLMQTELDYRQR